MNSKSTRKKKQTFHNVGKILVIIIIFALFLVVRMGYTYHYFSFPLLTEKIDEISTENIWTDGDFLQVSGNNIVNQRGEIIVLEGVNLGGWLLQEYWMCPVHGSEEISQWTNLETLNVLEERFGVQRTQELVRLYEDNWITEWDIQNIAAIGCNVIRVPFWYRNFMSNPNGDWINENLNENPGFQKLDWVIEMAEKYGLYVILDMHGCPGGQSTDHCSGSARKSELFTNADYQDSMEKLWIAIASRYKGNPTVAAYDIMNEAQINGEIESIQQDPRNILYDRMYRAIRNVDPDHIIMIEGIWELSVLPSPDEMGWNNVVYQVHSYGIADTDSKCKEYIQYSQQYNVPIYVGEFSDLSLMENCRKYGIHYTSWTYKGDRHMEEPWFMYYADKMLPVNVYTDPYWLIKLKWGNCLSTQYFIENDTILELWNREE